MNWSAAFMPVVFTLIVISASIGFVLLPNFPTQLGGAKPHVAVLTMVPADVGPALRRDLFDEAVWNSTTPEETRDVTVVFRTSEWLFVRVPPDDSRNDRSYEIHRDAVVNVRWR